MIFVQNGKDNLICKEHMYPITIIPNLDIHKYNLAFIFWFMNLLYNISEEYKTPKSHFTVFH